MATIRDVAERAGVSVGTVSRVLSGNATVKQRLRERVQAVIEELDYKPNQAARALRTNRVDVIGLVVPDITNPFFAQLAKAIETEAASHGQFVMLANTHDDLETESRQIMALLDRSPRGLIVVASSDSPEASIDSDVPILSIDRRFRNRPLACIDNEHGSIQIAEHLHALGHRSICYISGPPNTEVGRVRQNGFVQRIRALSTHDDPIDLEVREGQFSFESGETIGHDIMSGKRANMPSAVAAASDQIAIGVMRAARDRGLKVPADIALTGFDDIDMSALAYPRLTTIRQPIQALARAVIAPIIDTSIASHDVKIRGSLIVRGSTVTAESRSTVPLAGKAKSN
ncbi:LacI family transcriptional regulator [Aliiruegeria haliotis]|uniref:LacI family transcriptional regulator n=1 Tax=Aliiruegeria haliotis TaxID=1280846 RepID=A0A2T0RPW4_9RHOB|nr:LacI family DNA-binding transcriptional regulator [Aliiruegeria haliotis]PRY23191.1 LacI family transcriptional regulator [Aliiruegeria haliotis]